MIEQSVRIHDRHQVEFKLGYRLGDFEEAKSYDISLFFFIPASLGITPATYSKRDFFNDLIAHIRVKTPAYLLRELASGPESPLKGLESSLAQFAAQPTPANRSACERQLKMFCCIAKSAMRDHVGALATRRSPADQKDLAEQFLTHVLETCKAFRGLRTIINVPTVSKTAFSRFLFADEFLSILAENYAYEMLEALKAQGNGAFAEFQPRLLELARSEIAYRSASGYPSLPTDGGDNENLVFRRSVLKKYAESVLFLGVRAGREGTLVEQSVFAAAAGLSMVFATAVAFFFQKTYGNFTFPLFVALVVSYMFKDRVKELLRKFFATRVQRFFFDRRLQIFNDPLATERIGTCRESFDFVKGEQLPASVERLRNRDHITEIENGWLGETVALYRKRITLLPQWFKRAQGEYRLEGINDILRLNFSEFLLRMDEPTKSLWFTDGTSYRRVDGQRVYHVNLVVRCSSGGSLDERRFRIVLNKEGIKRIEDVGGEHAVARPQPDPAAEPVLPLAAGDDE